MNIDSQWIPLLGAVGVGAIATKLLDVLWLQRVLHESERRKWLREQRYRVFSELAREILSSPFLPSCPERRFLELVADSILLSTDKDLIELLQGYYPAALSAQTRLSRFINNGTSTVDEREAMRLHENETMTKLANNVVSRLRASL